jgi:hypothetical protein
MWKYCALFSFLSIIQVNAAEVLRMQEYSNGKNNQHSMVNENKSPSTSRKLRNFTFDEFADKDPYEREEEYQRLLKLKNFPEAAIALLGAASNGDSDSMDYILKLDRNAFDYIRSKDLKQTQDLISKISEDLKR